LSDPFTGFQRHFLDMSDPGPDMSDELYDRWNLISTGLVRPFSRHVRVLTKTCHLSEFSSVSGLSRFGVTLLVWPIKGTLPLSRGLLVPDHLHNLSTASWALPNLSLWDLSPLWKILELGGEFCVWALEFKPWALWAASSIRDTFVTLEGEAS
jgi:hypothetical protein